MAFNLAQVGRQGVEALGRKGWLRRPFFWAGFLTLRLAYPVQFLLLRELIDCESVLDLGCGRHSMVPILPKSVRTVGVEFFKPHLDEAVAKKRHHEYVHADITKVDFPAKSFDAVVLLDVIEHLKPEEGRELIEKMERWARKKLVVFTPNGYLHQEEFDENPLMAHQSGWTVADFKAHGFNKIFGVRGFKGWKKGCHDHDHGCEGDVDSLADISQIYTYHAPEKAFQLFAVKELRR